MALRRILLVDCDLQEFFGTGMVFGFTVLGYVLLVLVSGSEGGCPAHKLVRKLGFMVGDLEGRYNIVRRRSHTLGSGEEKYSIVSLELIGVVVEDSHDDRRRMLKSARRFA